MYNLAGYIWQKFVWTICQVFGVHRIRHWAFTRGHGGRVVTLLPPTSEVGVRFPARPQVGKFKAGSCLPLVGSLYSTEPWPTVCTGFLCPSNCPSWYDLCNVEKDVTPQIKIKISLVMQASWLSYHNVRLHLYYFWSHSVSYCYSKNTHTTVISWRYFTFQHLWRTTSYWKLALLSIQISLLKIFWIFFPQ